MNARQRIEDTFRLSSILPVASFGIEGVHTHSLPLILSAHLCRECREHRAVAGPPLSRTSPKSLATGLGERDFLHRPLGGITN